MYIIVPVTLFLYAVINNIFSFITFRRPKPKLIGVSYYLLVNSITSQLSLFCLTGKILHVLSGTRGLITQYMTNIVLCKTLSFLLSACTRICYWLIAFVTIERVYVTMYPKRQWLKQPKIAKRIIILITVATLASHSHELIKYTIVNDPKYTTSGE
jgi:hypothetical protein